MHLYRVSQRPHQPGFVMTAGHFGSVYQTYTMQGVAADPYAPWRLASEMIVERIRAIEFPDRPSRLTCCYAWPDEANARLSQSQSPDTVIELVEAVNPHAKQFIADFALMLGRSRLQPSLPFLEMNERLARQYWGGTAAQAPEVLIESDLRVIGMLP